MFVQTNLNPIYHYAIISYRLQTLNVIIEIPWFDYTPSISIPRRDGI